MDPINNAVLASWTLDPPVIALLLLVGALYLRGWIRGRRVLRQHSDLPRLYAFLSGLAVLFIAGESPLDTFDRFFLAAHMAQHLLLMMLAPLLILLAHPFVPMLRGLPKPFVKEALVPFLTWKPLKRLGHFFTQPVFTWLAFASSTILWHVPACYELALRSSGWHEVQHASFFWTGILFWWPIVQPGPGRVRWPDWAKIPYLLFSDVINTGLSAAFVFSGRLLYPSYAGMRTGSLSPQDDQTLAGLIMWVPGSLVYLIPAFVIAVRLFSSGRAMERQQPVRVRSVAARRWSLLAFARWRSLLQAGMLLLAIAVMADGFFGPQIAPLNLAGVLPWIHWRALAILALLMVGNLFCMACPFTLVRDVGRRVFAANWRWPQKLRNKWIPTTLFLAYLWAYEAFGLWNSPWITAWIIAGYFLAALLVDTLFRGASFCKYVCPIGQFHFVTSLISPREIGIKRAETCRSCRSYDCIRGNETSRGCELYLFQPKKVGNVDCTFCLDCVKACPHQNVGLISIAPAKTLLVDSYRSSIGRLSKRSDLAALALLFVFGAFVNAAGMVSPVMRWEHGWHARLGPGAMPWIVASFVLLGCVVIPAFVIAFCAMWNRAFALPRGTDFLRRSALALVPIGAGMWAAHVLFHLANGWAAFWPALSRMVAGGADYINAASPSWLSPLQILVLNAGLLLTLYIGWRTAQQFAARNKQAIALAVPWGLLALGLYCAGIWILFQPMQMRGMLH